MKKERYESYVCSVEEHRIKEVTFEFLEGLADCYGLTGHPVPKHRKVIGLITKTIDGNQNYNYRENVPHENTTSL
tara:strand:+ start:296 stop:520 length:225 start_codon:yes stop_codon:yes gene_type:complete